MKLLYATIFAILSAISSWADEAVQISASWARATILISRPGAAYLTLASPVDDRLVTLKTPVAEAVMIHKVETIGDISRMVHVPELELPAGVAVTLAPGGMHLMLMGLREKLIEGDSFQMELSFASGAKISVEFPVLGLAAKGPVEGQ